MAGPGTGAAPEDGGISAVRLLRTNPPSRALFSARTVSFTGEAVSLVAPTGRGSAVSLLLLVGDIVPGLLGPLTGAIGDRFDRRRVMIACELAQAALLLIALSLPPLPPLPLLLLLVAARATAGQVFLPASRAAAPALVRGRDLESANSCVGFGTNGAEAVGPLLAAALFPLLGIPGVLLGAAASYVLSAFVPAALPPLPPGDRRRRPASLLADAGEGGGYIWSVRPVRPVRLVALGFCLVLAFNGIDDVALVVLATETLGASDSAVGLLLGAVGIGLVAGYALLARWGPRASLPVLLVVGLGE